MYLSVLPEKAEEELDRARKMRLSQMDERDDHITCILRSSMRIRNMKQDQVRVLIAEKGGRAVCFLAESKKFEY